MAIEVVEVIKATPGSTNPYITLTMSTTPQPGDFLLVISAVNGNRNVDSVTTSFSSEVTKIQSRGASSTTKIHPVYVLTNLGGPGTLTIKTSSVTTGVFVAFLIRGASEHVQLMTMNTKYGTYAPRLCEPVKANIGDLMIGVVSASAGSTAQLTVAPQPSLGWNDHSDTTTGVGLFVGSRFADQDNQEHKVDFSQLDVEAMSAHTMIRVTEEAPQHKILLLDADDPTYTHLSRIGAAVYVRSYATMSIAELDAFMTAKGITAIWSSDLSASIVWPDILPWLRDRWMSGVPIYFSTRTADNYAYRLGVVAVRNTNDMANSQNIEIVPGAPINYPSGVVYIDDATTGYRSLIGDVNTGYSENSVVGISIAKHPVDAGFKSIMRAIETGDSLLETNDPMYPKYLPPSGVAPARSIWSGWNLAADSTTMSSQARIIVEEAFKWMVGGEGYSGPIALNPAFRLIDDVWVPHDMIQM